MSDNVLPAAINKCVQDSESGSMRPTFHLGDTDSDANKASTSHCSVGVQVDLLAASLRDTTCLSSNKRANKPLAELKALVAESYEKIAELNDCELIELLKCGTLKASQLEKILPNDERRAVHVRRLYVSDRMGTSKSAGDPQSIERMPYLDYDYSYNVLGYVPVPLGYAGPLLMNGRSYFVPLATTEGCLVASTNRGCRAIAESGDGVTAVVYRDGMSRGPALQFTAAKDAIKFKNWIEKDDKFRQIKQKFDGTSRHCRLQSIKCQPAGRVLYVRFVASTGDAMGMNMLSKATEVSLQWLVQEYTEPIQILTLSGNYCTDKKAAAINMIDGRGKSVVCDVVLSGKVIKSVLHTTPHALVQVSECKNVGSALAGCNAAGMNSHAANIVSAMFIATGQDVGQVVTSSACVCLLQTQQSTDGADTDLYMSVTLPCLEVGTVGGGTLLPAQHAALQMLGCAGGNSHEPGANCSQLACCIAAVVLAAELSLLAALSTNDLVHSHLKMNRSQLNVRQSSLAMQQQSHSDLQVCNEQTPSLLTRAVKGYLQPNACSHII